jgi:uncharacterized protein YecA (UPF0149 family)
MRSLPQTQANSGYRFTLFRAAFSLLLALGCSHSLAERTARYAELSGKTALSLKPVVALAHRTCEQSRRAEFLQQRLVRLKSESLKVPLGSEYYIDGPHWSEMVASTANGLTWSEYCQAMDQSAAAFAAGTSALLAHADALGEMAEQSHTYQPDFGALQSGAEALEQGIRKQDDPWLKLVPSLTNPIKELSHLWLAEQNQAELRDLVVHAEPFMSELITALQQYLDALAGQLATLSSRQSTLIQSFELNSGFGAQAEAVRGLRCHSPAPDAAPDVSGIAELCERSRLQQRELDALVLLLLHDNEETLNAATAADLAMVAQFKDILQAFSASNKALAQLARAKDDTSLRRASQNLQQLAELLQSVTVTANERNRLR